MTKFAEYPELASQALIIVLRIHSPSKANIKYTKLFSYPLRMVLDPS